MRGAGRSRALWAMLILLLAAPTVCLLWFMNAAMQNERLAFRQNLADAYRGEFAQSGRALEGFWKEMTEKLEKIQSRGAAAFAEALESGFVDSAIIFDERGRPSYPSSPSSLEIDVVP